MAGSLLHGGVSECANFCVRGSKGRYLARASYSAFETPGVSAIALRECVGSRTAPFGGCDEGLYALGSAMLGFRVILVKFVRSAYVVRERLIICACTAAWRSNEVVRLIKAENDLRSTNWPPLVRASRICGLASRVSSACISFDP